jgi:hypothetical protein
MKQTSSLVGHSIGRHNEKCEADAGVSSPTLLLAEEHPGVGCIDAYQPTGRVTSVAKGFAGATQYMASAVPRDDVAIC